jgi:hypothetical protein
VAFGSEILDVESVSLAIARAVDSVRMAMRRYSPLPLGVWPTLEITALSLGRLAEARNYSRLPGVPKTNFYRPLRWGAPSYHLQPSP